MLPRKNEHDVDDEVDKRSSPPSIDAVNLQVLYRTADFLVIDKPPDVRMQGEFTVNVEKLVEHFCPPVQISDLKFIHRLDFSTSGVLCLGLTKKGARAAVEAFVSRNAIKNYVAVVHGHVNPHMFPVSQHSFSENRTVRILKRPKPTLTPQVFGDIRRHVAEKDAAVLSKQEKEFLEHASFEDAHQVKRMRKFMFNFLNDNAKEEETTLVDVEPITPAYVAQSHPLHSEPSTYRPSDDSDDFYITANIAQVPDDFRMQIGVVGNTGRNSCTHGRVLEQGMYMGQPVTKVLLHPITGRRHQLRVHLRHAGFPIVGDATYAKDMDDAPRMMLHALELMIPIDGSAEGNAELETISCTTTDPFPFEEGILQPILPAYVRDALGSADSSVSAHGDLNS